MFEGLSVWEEERYRKLQGTYPVINLSFARVKETNYEYTKIQICQIITDLYNAHRFLLEGDFLSDNDKEFFCSVSSGMPEYVATVAINKLSEFLYRYYGKKVIILLDEYDTPMQEAYLEGYWDEMVSFTRSLFNSTFKTNPYMERAVMTGITRISKESVFSDLNKLKVVTTTSYEYAAAFGFTEDEVFDALDEYSYSERYEDILPGTQPRYELAITNIEINVMFRGIVSDWFSDFQPEYNSFIKALVLGDLEDMM